MIITFACLTAPLIESAAITWIRQQLQALGKRLERAVSGTDVERRATQVRNHAGGAGEE